MISIHQSQFLSWSPFYYKVLKSDHFIVLDDVQFQKNGVQNRNLIKTPQGESWITLPVKHTLDTPINEVLVSDLKAYEKMLKSIELNYKKSPFFDEIFQVIQDIFQQTIQNLHEVNNALLLKFLGILNSQAVVNYSSGLETVSKKDDLVIEIIKKMGDHDYLSGSGALAYMDLEKFKKENIKVYTYKFTYTPYKQQWENKIGFVPNLSVIDLLFNEKDNVSNYLAAAGVITRII